MKFFIIRENLFKMFILKKFRINFLFTFIDTFDVSYINRLSKNIVLIEITTKCLYLENFDVIYVCRKFR